MASKITMDSHILAHAKIQCPDDSHSKLELYISELILDRKLTHTNSIRNNASHDLTLIKMNVSRFVGAESLLIKILYRSYEMKTSPIKEAAPLYLTQHYSFDYKKKKVNFKVSITELYPSIPWEQ